MKTLKEQVNDLNENQNHILEAVKNLNQRLEYFEENCKVDKINDLQDIIEGQENIDEIIVKNSDDIICIKKKKEENAASIQILEDKICTIDNDIATMTTKLQNQLERITVEVKENDSKVNDKKELKIKCKFFNSGFCRRKENCPFVHKTLDVCNVHENGIKCENRNCENRHPKLCRYYRRGSCFRNESCYFLHTNQKP